MITATVDPAFAIGIAATLISGAVMAWNAFRKTPAEVESISVATLTLTVKTLSSENERLVKRVGELESEREADQERIDKLERAVLQLGGSI